MEEEKLIDACSIDLFPLVLKGPIAIVLITSTSLAKLHRAHRISRRFQVVVHICWGDASCRPQKKCKWPDWGFFSSPNDFFSYLVSLGGNMPHLAVDSIV